jgi:hypothetical protein
MARPPKPENARNPLRQLRTLLSKNGEIAPITQNRLSEICDIPIDTIRAIEAGRRTLSLSVLRKTEAATTAKWNSKLARWTVYDSDEPLTFSWYSLHRRFMGRRPPNHQRRIHFIHTKIDGLFDKIPGNSWNLLLFRMNDFLEECKHDFNLKDLDDVFYKAESRFEEFSAFLKNQKVPKPTYLNTDTASPSTLKRAKREPTHRGSKRPGALNAHPFEAETIRKAAGI